MNIHYGNEIIVFSSQLSCSGGSWPAGIDTSYPKKAIYPGVIAFYRELDLGYQFLGRSSVGGEEWDSSRVGNLVFLSARPHVYKDVSENVTYNKLKFLQEERGLHTSPTLLAGSLDTGSQFIVKGNCEPLAAKKFENFKEYLSLYPEFTCIFIGDNGQGDVRTAEMIMDDPKLRDNLHRVYIHVVQPMHLTYTKHKYSTLANKSICFFVTYIQAAIDAYHHRLIGPSGLRRLMEEAVNDFHLISWATTKSEEKHAASLSNSVAKGVASPNRGGAASVGSVVKSGRESPAVTGTTLGGRVRNAVSTPPPVPFMTEEEKREMRIREINKDLEVGNSLLKSLDMIPVCLLSFPSRVNIGCFVRTVFGTGIVVSYRPSDGIYEVKVSSELFQCSVFMPAAEALSH